ncbi:peptidoglycan domain protein [Campylobacter sp. RM12920]|uniref:Peptidoglycan domain protein n=1 Tax=Campylobacter californiensis TaxID=1032243 RepID=A0ABD4JFJ9_9BACT|nr:putative peptidoglycan-binding domain-containing protein [Campylobacter sp. RM9328]MBE2985563.1 peptidoglycan domain protein [Campylobacter sp. RM12919]MBE2987408.1 peptidoglycan domain protein [Campylobacter sp. RM12920]
MPNFNEALEILYTLEFSNPSNALHKNPTEEAYTFMGIYEKAHPSWGGWVMVHEMIRIKGKDLKAASKILMQNEFLLDLVAKFYKERFWDRMRLDEIESQLKANEIFIFGVNVGCRVAIKTAQRVAGVINDGYMGEQSIAAINRIDEAVFDRAYDDLELAYYDRPIERNPSFRIYARGWRKRALAV